MGALNPMILCNTIHPVRFELQPVIQVKRKYSMKQNMIMSKGTTTCGILVTQSEKIYGFKSINDLDYYLEKYYLVQTVAKSYLGTNLF